MLTCKVCGNKMNKVMRFTPKMKEKFYRCNKCKYESKHRRIAENELTFGEVLSANKNYINRERMTE